MNTVVWRAACAILVLGLVLAVVKIIGLSSHVGSLENQLLANEDKLAATWASYRAEDQRRIFLQQGAQHEYNDQANKNRADSDLAQRTAERLRQRIEALEAARSTSNSASCPGSPSEARTGELLKQCAARLVEVAAGADAAVTSGRLCERSYDALHSP